MQTIYLDISNKGVVPCVYAKQDEVGRKFLAIITDAGLPYNIPEDTQLSVWYQSKTSAGHYSSVNNDGAFIVNDNQVTIELSNEMLSSPGDGVLCLTISEQSGTEISTWNIPYSVEYKPGTGSYVPELGGSGYSVINDKTVSIKQTWSSDKMSREIKPIIVTIDHSIGHASHDGFEINSAVVNGKDVILNDGDITGRYIAGMDDSTTATFLAISDNGVATTYHVFDDGTFDIYEFNLHSISKKAEINDSEIGTDAWSSQNIVDKLCPDFTKTDTLVQCNPVDGYPMTVFAKESSDVEGATVTVCGKNLYNREAFHITDGKYIVAAGGTTSSTGYACVEGFIPVTHLRGKKITLNHPPAETEGSAPRMVFYIEANATAESVIAEGKTNSYTTTVPNTANYMRFSVPKKYADGTQIQIEVGEKVTAYEPYYKKIFEASGDAAGEFIPVNGIVGRAGLMTVYAENDNGVTEVKVSGKADPRAEIGRLNDTVDKLTADLAEIKTRMTEVSEDV